VLFVRKGDTRVSVNYSGPPRPALEAEQRALMTKILSNL
jgi:hypothetical protein